MDKDNFYIGEDGLECCAVCQEPMEKEKQERKEREHQQEVEKNTTI